MSTRFPPHVVEVLREARSVGVITGAGISVPSGIRPYRGQGGLYDDPEEGDRVVEALSASTLHTDPQRTWNAVRTLALQAQDARPNPAHHALVTLEERCEDFTLLTQNVDGLHRAAGTRNLIELHGRIDHLRCDGCGHTAPFSAWPRTTAPPPCPHCARSLRVDVVLFEEMLPPTEVARMEGAFTLRTPELLLAVGTTALFPYIVEPVLRTNAMGGYTLEINPESTVLSDHVDTRILEGADTALPALLAEAFGP